MSALELPKDMAVDPADYDNLNDYADACARLAADRRTRNRSILCLDFDGVIHSYTSGWKGARVIPDAPVPGAIHFMLAMLGLGWDVCIHSSRSGSFGGRRAMRRWLKHHAGAAWWPCQHGPGLEDVRFPLFKPSAKISIDDRALTFDGTWPDPALLDQFQPWSKRPDDSIVRLREWGLYQTALTTIRVRQIKTENASALARAAARHAEEAARSAAIAAMADFFKKECWR